MARIDIGGASTIGKRHHQEDGYMAYHIVEELPEASAQFRRKRERQVYMGVLCDGMGGEGEGDFCAREAVQAYAEAFAETGSYNNMWRQRMCMSLYAANAAVHYFKYCSEMMHTNSGCTLVSAVVSDDLLHFISVGDSYIWLFRRKDSGDYDAQYDRLDMNTLHLGYIRTLTGEDGSQTEALIMPDEAEKPQPPNATLKQCGGPYCALVGREIGYLSAGDPEGFRLRDGDILVLASDGVIKGLGDINLDTVIRTYGGADISARQLADEIIRAIGEHGRDPKQDNASCVVFKYTEN